jgi:hypothetical protein
MVPGGGIEPSPIQLKVHHFLNDDFPVYLPVDPALSSAGRVRLCGAVPKSCACHALYKRCCALIQIGLVIKVRSPLEGEGHTFESCRARRKIDAIGRVGM